MFNTGDVVLYGAQGVCKVADIQQKQIGKTVLDYYVLRPVFNENTSVFVPVENAVLTARMQNLLTVLQVNDLIEKTPQITTIDIKDENSKRDIYKNALSLNDRVKLVSVIKTIRTEQSERRKSGKKLNTVDEQTLRKAEQLLFNEVAFVLGITPDEAGNKFKF